MDKKAGTWGEQEGSPSLVTVTHTHLSESCDPIPHVWENGGLVTHLEVKVDSLVREGGELVTEAEPINALGLRLVREAVVLLLGLPVDDVAHGVFHIAVHVVVASSDNLTTTKSVQLRGGNQNSEMLHSRDHAKHSII